ncbi:MAG: hypothetical protein HGB12_10765 [Bacteroidetes bacterium]|nr:hypothetical protein [Bacteroidota bacterium]
MFDPKRIDDIKDYISKYKDLYSIKAIRNAVLESDYTNDEFNEALVNFPNLNQINENEFIYKSIFEKILYSILFSIIVTLVCVIFDVNIYFLYLFLIFSIIAGLYFPQAKKIIHNHTVLHRILSGVVLAPVYSLILAIIVRGISQSLYVYYQDANNYALIALFLGGLIGFVVGIVFPIGKKINNVAVRRTYHSLHIIFTVVGFIFLIFLIWFAFAFSTVLGGIF